MLSLRSERPALLVNVRFGARKEWHATTRHRLLASTCDAGHPAQQSARRQMARSTKLNNDNYDVVGDKCRMSGGKDCTLLPYSAGCGCIAWPAFSRAASATSHHIEHRRAAMMRFAGEFGLTPVARSRLAAGVGGQLPGGGKFDGCSAEHGRTRTQIESALGATPDIDRGSAELAGDAHDPE